MGGTCWYRKHFSLDNAFASRKVLRHVQSSRQSEGWHPVKMKGTGAMNGAGGVGVYFVRFALDGQYQPAKRVLVIQ